MGVFLGFIFGLTNASFIWASRTVVERMDSKPAEVASQVVSSDVSTTSEEPKDRLEQLKDRLTGKLSECGYLGWGCV